jgi:hypothetical protein
MTVRINKPALNLREELTKAQGVVRYEQRQFWMDGLVENGTFDTDLSGWAITNPSGSTVVYSSGRLRIVTNGVGAGATQKVFDIGKRYYISFDYEAVSGALKLDSIISTLNTTQTYSTIWTSTQQDLTFYRSSGSAEGYIDNVRVFEVDENDNIIHSVPLGFKPVHVYEDGLLQREGTNHDYTVVDTGFGYQIKPTVAPTGATETCIIAEREL